MSSDKVLKEIPGKCPTPDDLGHAGWAILHTAAAVYPYKPSPVQQEAFRNLLHGWSHVYACSHCSYHMRRYLKRNPPIVTDKLALNRYLCEFHNSVNKNVGNDIYDCDPMTVLRRWHPRFPDMEDEPTIEEQIAEQQRLEKAKAQKKQADEELQQKQQQQQQGRPSLFGNNIYSSNPQQRGVERWRSHDTETSSGMRSQGSSLGASSGWATSSEQEEKEKKVGVEGSVKSSTTTPVAESTGKKWWLFGRASNATNPMSTNVNNTSSSSTTGEEEDNEKNVMDVLKRLKACMVYCPDKDKKGTHA